MNEHELQDLMYCMGENDPVIDAYSVSDSTMNRTLLIAENRTRIIHIYIKTGCVYVEYRHCDILRHLRYGSLKLSDMEIPAGFQVDPASTDWRFAKTFIDMGVKFDFAKLNNEDGEARRQVFLPYRYMIATDTEISNYTQAVMDAGGPSTSNGCR